MSPAGGAGAAAMPEAEVAPDAARPRCRDRGRLPCTDRPGGRPNPRVADGAACRRETRDHDPRRKEASPVLVQRHDAARRRDAGARRSTCRRRRRCVRCSARRRLPPLPTTRRGDVVVACTQEARLFGDVAEEGGTDADDPLRQHPRDRRVVGAGDARRRRRSPRCWRWPDCPNPIRCPAWRTGRQGQLLIVGPADAALHWAGVLAPQLAVTRARHRPRRSARSCRRSAQLPGLLGGQVDRAHRLAGRLRRRVGAGQSDRPRPVHALQCVHQGLSRERDRLELPGRSSTAASSPSRLRGRLRRRPGRSTSRARTSRAASASTSCSTSRATPTLRMHQPPQGYLAPGRRPGGAGQAVADLAAMVGEFEKPKFFTYKSSLCAHSRSQKTGCNQCIDVCSTAAIRADGDHVVVEPHLCMGCGACATVCPSGAMAFALSRGAAPGRPPAHGARHLREGRRARRLHPAARRGRRRDPVAARAAAAPGCRRG